MDKVRARADNFFLPFVSKSLAFVFLISMILYPEKRAGKTGEGDSPSRHGDVSRVIDVRQWVVVTFSCTCG
jgi:hypothetical protein